MKKISLILVSACLFVVVGCHKKSTFDWESNSLSKLLPEPDFYLDEENVYTSGDDFSINIEDVDSEEYQEYVKEVKKAGFDKRNFSELQDDEKYSAYNSKGDLVKISLLSDEMSIDIIKGLKYGVIKWPTRGYAANVLVEPKNLYGKIVDESEKYFRVVVGKTSKKEFDQYVDATLESGFDKDYDKAEYSFNGKNKEGCRISIDYLGNNSMEISMDASSVKKEAKKTKEKKQTINSTKTKKTSDSNQGGKGVSKNLKKTLDDYEKFIDDYVAFMQKYNDSSDQTSMMKDYAKYMRKYSKVMKQINELENEDMSIEEYEYFIEVQTRILEKVSQI